MPSTQKVSASVECLNIRCQPKEVSALYPRWRIYSLHVNQMGRQVTFLMRFSGTAAHTDSKKEEHVTHYKSVCDAMSSVWMDYLKHISRYHRLHPLERQNNISPCRCNRLDVRMLSQTHSSIWCRTKRCLSKYPGSPRKWLQTEGNIDMNGWHRKRFTLV